MHSACSLSLSLGRQRRSVGVAPSDGMCGHARPAFRIAFVASRSQLMFVRTYVRDYAHVSPTYTRTHVCTYVGMFSQMCARIDSHSTTLQVQRNTCIQIRCCASWSLACSLSAANTGCSACRRHTGRRLRATRGRAFALVASRSQLMLARTYVRDGERWYVPTYVRTWACKHVYVRIGFRSTSKQAQRKMCIQDRCCEALSRSAVNAGSSACRPHTRGTVARTFRAAGGQGGSCSRTYMESSSVH